MLKPEPCYAAFEAAIAEGLRIGLMIAEAIPGISEDDSLEEQLFAREKLMNLEGLIRGERQALEASIVENLVESETYKTQTDSFEVEVLTKTRKAWDTKKYVDILIDSLKIDPKEVFATLRKWEPSTKNLKAVLEAHGQGHRYQSVIDASCIVREEGRTLYVKKKEDRQLS